MDEMPPLNILGRLGEQDRTDGPLSDEEVTSALEALRAPGRVSTPKMLREALCAAQSALSERARGGMDVDRVPYWIADLGALITQIDEHRPLGQDGKHNEQHTPTCGCEGHHGAWGIVFGCPLSYAVVQALGAVLAQIDDYENRTGAELVQLRRYVLSAIDTWTKP